MREPRVKARRHRLSRFFLDSGFWYVELRQGRLGPFHRYEQALQSLEQFKRRILLGRT